jgi:predicted nucleic acid-binding protein
LELLPKIFSEIWTTNAVVLELKEGQKQGFDVPIIQDYDWLKIVNPRFTPSEWLALDLGPGELATMALALENPDFVVILDDSLARNTAHAADLEVWGTLKMLLEGKKQGLIEKIQPLLHDLKEAGMWLSQDIIQRILFLAGEK